MWRVKTETETDEETTHETLRGATGSGNVTVGNATVGITTVGSLVTNISTTGAATVNIGNTGTSVNAGSIVNIGSGATGINIGSSNSLLKLTGKVRLSSTPLLVYYFTTAQTQTITNDTDTAILWPTAASYNGTSTGLTFNSGIGLFTNSNSYPIIVTCSLIVGYTKQNTGPRVAWLQHTVGDRFACTNLSAGIDFSTITASGSIVLLAGEGFYAYTYQSSGGNLVIGGEIANTSLTRLSILVM